MKSIKFVLLALFLSVATIFTSKAQGAPPVLYASVTQTQFCPALFDFEIQFQGNSLSSEPVYTITVTYNISQTNGFSHWTSTVEEVLTYVYTDSNGNDWFTYDQTNSNLRCGNITGWSITNINPY